MPTDNATLTQQIPYSTDEFRLTPASTLLRFKARQYLAAFFGNIYREHTNKYTGWNKVVGFSPLRQMLLNECNNSPKQFGLECYVHVNKSTHLVGSNGGRYTSETSIKNHSPTHTIMCELDLEKCGIMKKNDQYVNLCTKKRVFAFNLGETVQQDKDFLML